MTRPTHVPVLREEVIEGLAVREGGRYIDATTGLGGHSEAIAALMGDEGELLCIDQDGEALEIARARLTPNGRRIRFAQGNFRDLATIAADHQFADVDGILLDLGVSSLQLGGAARGFAFGLEGPLDMRMDQGTAGDTASDIVNTWDEWELIQLLRQFGERRFARRIAGAIVRGRPLRTTWELARAVEQAVRSAGGGRTPTHPATKVFLALRSAVNGELDCLDDVLPQARDLLGFGTRGGGRLAVISFHSLEDGAVKRFLRRESSDCLCPPRLPQCRCGHSASLRLINRRVIRPADDEIAANPRARSATLRIAERIA